MNKTKIFGIFILTLMLCSCANQYSLISINDPYGFFSGIWHGMIFPFSLIGTIVFDDVYIIGKPNTGFGYHFGFFMGFLGIGVPRFL
jgi:hypothetical protein